MAAGRFFLHEIGPVAQHSNRAADKRRVAIVGGGIVGCAIAYRLARAGMKVVLIERDGIAAHASGHNAGNLNPLHGTPLAMRALTLEAFALHRNIAAELAQLGCAKFTMMPTERIHLGCNETDRRDLAETASIFAVTPGFSSAWLEGDMLARVEPGLARDFQFGVVTHGNLSVDSADYAHSLMEAASRLGATHVHDIVIGIVASGGRATGVRVGGGIIECDEVVFATGPWVAELKSWLGVEVRVEPVKGELLLMQMQDGAPNHDLAWGATALYRRRGDQLWIGGTTEKNGFDCAPSKMNKELLLDNAARVFPQIRHATLLDHVAALRPMTASNRPIAERADGWQNVAIANGGGAKGVLLSAVIAKNICDLLSGGTEVLRATSLS